MNIYQGRALSKPKRWLTSNLLDLGHRDLLHLTALEAVKGRENYAPDVQIEAHSNGIACDHHRELIVVLVEEASLLPAGLRGERPVYDTRPDHRQYCHIFRNYCCDVCDV